jgi:hypothetical protein
MPEARGADQTTAVRPILKWAGGKRQLLPALRPYYPEYLITNVKVVD